jgi:YihY family inner membrane protein
MAIFVRCRELMHNEIPKSPLALTNSAEKPDLRPSALLRGLEHLNARFWRVLAHVAEEGVEGGAWRVRRRITHILRVLVMAALSFTVNEVPVRAAALVFTTLLAFIPLTIILSSVAGWLGYLELLRQLIPDFLGSLNLDLPIDPLMRGLERARSVGFHQLGLMGSLGLLAGFYLSMSNIEEAMNRVWNVRASRGWYGRFSRYTPFLLLMLVIIVLSVFLLFRARQILDGWGFSGAFSLAIPGSAFLFGSLGAVFFMWMLMVLMIRLLPNTRVRLTAAFLGATAGIVPLYFLSRFLLLFPALLLERNQVFYGSLAFFPVALLLVYVFWACALFGCAVAFVHVKLHEDAGHAFFTRSAGLKEDWEEAMREIEDLYRRPSRPLKTNPETDAKTAVKTDGAS